MVDSLLLFLISVIGIEFGDTYSRVAVQEQGEAIILANDQGELQTPNYVAYTSQGILVGQPAKDQVVMNSKNTVYDVR
jgi:molecular chaperone DnaK (HSP70)